MRKKQKIIKINYLAQKKLQICMFTGFIMLFLLIFRIGYLQFSQGAYLKKQATNNQLTSRTIAASRGSIYDATGKTLAISTSVDTVYINPSQVKYSNGTDVNKEILAHGLSTIFSLNYDELLEKINTNTSSFVLASKVENDKIVELQTWLNNNKITSGISIEEDIKRSYPYSNLASNLIGFTGTDNIGLSGLESSLNDILARYLWKNFNFYRFCKWRNTQ